MMSRLMSSGLIAAAALAVVLLCSAPAAAQWRQDARATEIQTDELVPSILPALRGDLPPWQRALYKTITFQAVANATDLLLFDALIGGHSFVLGGFVVANAASAAGLYYGFEYLWQQEGPTLEDTTETTILKKSLLFQTVNGGRIFLLGYGLGASAPAAALLAGSVFVTDTAVYFANEYVWDIMRPMASAPAEDRITASSVPVSYN